MTNLPDKHKATENINDQHLDLELRSDQDILTLLADSQRRAVEANHTVIPHLAAAVSAAAQRLNTQTGRLVLIGAGASGRLAVQDGAELWPTYGWPAERLVLQMAGGNNALLHSIEGVEDNTQAATREVETLLINESDVVLGLAASGTSPWTVTWLTQARQAGALTIGMANNANTPLLKVSEHAIWLNSGEEVLAGSTRMAAGTAQKVALNMFSTLLMIRLNRTYGNLMVDMAASNAKLDVRRLKMLHAIVPNLKEEDATDALAKANGWVKLAALIALGNEKQLATKLLESCSGNLRLAINKSTRSI